MKQKGLGKETALLKVKYALFCDYALVSQDGKFSLIGEFDRLYSTQEIATLTRGFLVAKVIGEPARELNLTVSFIKDGAKVELFKNDLTLKLDERGTAAVIMEISGLQFKEFGLYKAVVANGREIVVEVAFDVVKVNPVVARS